MDTVMPWHLIGVALATLLLIMVIIAIGHSTSSRASSVVQRPRVALCQAHLSLSSSKTGRG